MEHKPLAVGRGVAALEQAPQMMCSFVDKTYMLSAHRLPSLLLLPSHRPSAGLPPVSEYACLGSFILWLRNFQICDEIESSSRSDRG